MPRPVPEIPNASMADIAFLLLTFFLMTTTVSNDKGLSIQLPPPPEAVDQNVEFKIQEKNLFKIQINSFDNILVEGDPYTGSMNELKERIKKFVTNNGNDPESSESPKDAIVSFKTDRGTTHKRFVEVLDACEAAYNEIYAERAGVTVKRWLELSSDLLSDPENKRLYDLGRGRNPDGSVEIPKNISIAEPTKVGK